MQGQLTTGIAAQASIGSEKQNRAVIEPGKGPLKARRVAWEASLVSAIPRNLRRSQLPTMGRKNLTTGTPPPRLLCISAAFRVSLSQSTISDHIWRHEVWLCIQALAHYNSCRVHGAHNQTPAQAVGLTTEGWGIERLLDEANCR